SSKGVQRFLFFSSRRRHTRFSRDWSSDVCSSDLVIGDAAAKEDYDRIRFGGHGTFGPKEKPINPEIYVSQILEKLYEAGHGDIRSEERRVGKGCRCRGAR